MTWTAFAKNKFVHGPVWQMLMGMRYCIHKQTLLKGTLHWRGAGADGAPAIPHGSRVKVRLEHPGGFSVDRIPAWIRWATQEKGLGAHYNGVYWAPPADQRYAWCA